MKNKHYLQKEADKKKFRSESFLNAICAKVFPHSDDIDPNTTRERSASRFCTEQMQRFTSTFFPVRLSDFKACARLNAPRNYIPL